MNILICKNYKEFLKKTKNLSSRERRNTIGVSKDFLKKLRIDIDEYSELCEKSNLRMCWNCIDCKNCVDCLDCDTCSDCELCDECNNCERCYQCEYCGDCEECSSCKNCENCKNCDTCNYCMNSNNIEYQYGEDEFFGL